MTSGGNDGSLVFGERLSDVEYRERAASYVVILKNNAVAAVVGRRGYFLPGGGSLAGETPEQTISREVREELGRGVRLDRALGIAEQYFVAEGEGGYRMRASFFEGALTKNPRLGRVNTNFSGCQSQTWIEPFSMNAMLGRFDAPYR